MAVSFAEIQLDPLIAQGAVGGPTFKTVVVVAGSGAEQRVQLWSNARRAWEVSEALKTPAQHALLYAFWLARKGRLVGFRFKDWTDYKVTTPTATFALSYVVTLGAQTSGTFTLTLGGQTTTALAYNATAATVQTAMQALSTVGTGNCTVTGSAGGPYTVTFVSSVSTGGMTGNFASLSTPANANLSGLTFQLQNIYADVGGAQTTRTINKPVAGTVAIFNNTTPVVSGWTVDTTTGIVTFATAPGYLPNATFQFDVPVRFDIDRMEVTQESVGIRTWGRIPIVELLPGSY